MRGNPSDAADAHAALQPDAHRVDASGVDASGGDASGHDAPLAEVYVTGTPACRRIAVIGEVDLSNEADVAATVTDAMAGAGEVVIDLTGLAYLDSAGIRMLLQLYDIGREQRSDLHFAIDERSVVHRLLHISGLLDVLPRV